MKIIFEGKKKDTNEIQNVESFSPQGNSPKPKKKLSVEKIIIIILAVLLVVLAAFVLWDLYGKKISFNCPADSKASTSSTTSSTNSTSTQQQKKDSAATAVDASLYVTCTAKISDEKTYKSCCDALTADDTVKKACKKVVDDKKTTPTPTPSSQ